MSRFNAAARARENDASASLELASNRGGNQSAEALVTYAVAQAVLAVSYRLASIEERLAANRKGRR